jgi:hypothetical protein
MMAGTTSRANFLVEEISSMWERALHPSFGQTIGGLPVEIQILWILNT